MKKIVFVALSILMLNYSCSKKDHTINTAPPSSPALIKYPIDLNFNINPSCGISYDNGGGYPLMEENDFYFYAHSATNLPYNTSGANINVDQSYFFYDKSYSTATFRISENGSTNDFAFQPKSSFNFFTLTNQPGVASFSDTCYATAGSGQYITISQKTEPLIFSGFVDLTNHTGSIRVKGNIYIKQ